jgi:hypothetical protein
MRNVVKWGIVILCAPIVLIQLVRPDRANPPVDPARSVVAAAHVPPNVAAILERSCYDCHSNETRWPWYSNVAPVSWFVSDDVAEGRRQLNFSEWSDYPADEAAARLLYVGAVVRSGAMPLPKYLRVHPEARLSEADVEAVTRWVETENASAP